MPSDSKIYTFFSEEFGFSDFQIRQLRYFLLTILSESSKILLMGIFFFCMGFFKEYLFATAVLIVLRSCTGGIHLKHYTTCFFMTFAFLFASVCILPLIPTTKLIQMLFLLLCFFGNVYAAPIVSCYRPVPDGLKIRRSKLQATTILCIYIILLYVIPMNPLTTAGFWIIILQSAQLVVAKQLQRRERNEIASKKVDAFGM